MATKKKKVKGNDCDLRKGVFCAGLDRVLQGNTRAKGLVLLEFRSASQDFRVTKKMVAYRTGGASSKDNPIVLNVCPWCTKELGVIDT